MNPRAFFSALAKITRDRLGAEDYSLEIYNHPDPSGVRIRAAFVGIPSVGATTVTLDLSAKGMADLTPGVLRGMWNAEVAELEVELGLPKEEGEVPLLVEPVIGWREWTLNSAGQLTSLNENICWESGINEAFCSVHARHQAPVLDCGCGLYGYHTREAHLTENADGYGGHYAYGFFSAWGEIAVHPTGIRAQYARIEAVYASPPPTRNLYLERMKRRYPAVRVAASDEVLMEIAKEFGSPVPESLRPEPEPMEANPFAAASQVLQASYTTNQLTTQLQASGTNLTFPASTGTIIGNMMVSSSSGIAMSPPDPEPESDDPELEDSPWAILVGTILVLAAFVVPLAVIAISILR